MDGETDRKSTTVANHFPCPACGTDRPTAPSDCHRCGWPKRTSSQVVAPKAKKLPFQFHLRSLIIGVTVGCVVFALINRFGFAGFYERVEAATWIALILMSFVQFYCWWQARDLDNI